MQCGYRKGYLFFLSAVTLCFFSPGLLSAVVLDSNFGQNGKVATSLGNVDDRAYSVAIQPDGKIIVAGSSSSTANLDFALVRYNKDGSLDTSFNYNGSVVTPVGGDDDVAKSIVVLEDGKILAGGFSWNGNDRDFALVAYNPDGTLDRNFALDGISSSSPGNKDDEIVSLAVQQDGKILAAGYTTGTAGRLVVIARYLADGSPDPDFGEKGITFTGVSDEAEATRLAVQADGRIIVTGIYTEDKKHNIMLLRYQNDGSLDTDFGTDGLAIIGDQAAPTAGYGLELEDDGTIYIAGTIENDGNRDVALFRFTSEGRLDDKFGDHGKVVAGIGPEDDVGYDVRVQNGSVVIAGFTTENDVRRFLRLEYALDDKNLKVSEIIASTVEFGQNDEESQSLALQKDGKVVGVGYTKDVAGSKFAVARYQASEKSQAATTDTSSTDSTDDTNPYWWRPLIATTPLADITRNSALSGGVIRDNTRGRFKYKSRGIVLSQAPYPVFKSSTQLCNKTQTSTSSQTTQQGTDANTSQQSVNSDSGLEECYTEDGSGAGHYSSILTGLKIDTTYYIRAYTETDDGSIYYGNELTFTTADACFIATAAFGSILEPHVSVLRNFRDRYLLTNHVGRTLVQLYYRHSPPIADFVANHTAMKQFVRLALLPMIGVSSLILFTGLPSFILLMGFVIVCGVLSVRGYRNTCTHNL